MRVMGKQTWNSGSQGLAVLVLRGHPLCLAEVSSVSTVDHLEADDSPSHCICVLPVLASAGGADTEYRQVPRGLACMPHQQGHKWRLKALRREVPSAFLLKQLWMPVERLQKRLTCSLEIAFFSAAVAGWIPGWMDCVHLAQAGISAVVAFRRQVVLTQVQVVLSCSIRIIKTWLSQACSEKQSVLDCFLAGVPLTWEWELGHTELRKKEALNRIQRLLCPHHPSHQKMAFPNPGNSVCLFRKTQAFWGAVT